MKKFILLIIVIISFYQGKAQLFHEDFEVNDSMTTSGTQGWFPNNRLSVGGSFCDSSSIQNVGDTSILSTLFFDCSAASKIYLTFDHICKVDFFDRAIIEVSTDSGNTFVKLDTSNCVYTNKANLWNQSFSFFAASYVNWFPTSNSLMPDNSWWHHEVFNLTNLLSNKSGVVARFKLYDANNNGDGINAGWFIDNLKVDTLAQPDAGVISLLDFDITSVANSQKPVDVIIKNFSVDTAYSFNIGYSLNGSVPITQPWTGVLAPGDTTTVSLTAVTIPSGPFNLCAFTNIAGDIDHFNDTICISGNGLPILTIPYSDDFEGPNIGWLDPNPITEPTLWELGTPDYGVTNSAHTGTRCWDTNLDTSYLGPCNTILYSPYFDFSTVGNASVSFWLNYKTEALSDGTRLEYNANGTGWNILGLANNPLTVNWYTDSVINSTQQPGWEGNSGGWIQSTYPLPSILSNQASVQFRFIFSADNAVDKDGVSMDDFAINFSTCGNTIYSNTTPTSCGDSITFGFTPPNNIASIHWDLQNGVTSSQPTVSSFFTTGSYLVTVYTVDSNGCAASSVSPVQVTKGFIVNAGPDVIACGGASQLNAAVSVPGSYQYSWSPVIGLNNPLIPSPLVNHTDSTTYTLTVTDSVTGCIATDQLLASVYSGYNDVINICLGSAAILDLGPGANTYLWQIFTDTLGNIIPINSTNQNLFITQPGTYNATAVFPTCGVMNSLFQVTIDTACTTDVWPGDCNFDLTADNTDLLNIGVAYGITGSTRAGATTNWIAQPATDWSYYFSSGINYKHADSNGDGMVDSLDIPAILQNYGLSHPLKTLPGSYQNITLPAAYLTADRDTAGNSDSITITLNVGTTQIPVDSIYGIAYTISYDQSLIDTNSAAAYFSNSWLGTIITDMIGLEKHFASSGFSDFALVRNNHTNVLNGSGTLSVMTIVTTDNLSGIAKLNFNLHDVTAITFGQQIIPLTTSGDSVILDPTFTGISNINFENEILIYPNPVTSDLIVKSKNLKIISIELKNTLGQLVRKTKNMGTINHINVTDLSPGIFFLSVLTDKGVISKKVQVIK